MASKRKKIEDVTCANCGFVIATEYETETGKRQLVVHQKFGLYAKDLDKNEGSIICPKCNHEMSTDLSFWKRF